MANLNDPKAALDPSIDATYDDLNILRDIAKTCVRCDLSKTRTQVVFGDGPYVQGKLGIMIVGEAPGEDEDKQGRPFVGRSGKLLNTMLQEAGLSREDIWVTNTNKCRPVLIEGKVYKNRPPTPPEQKACEIWWHNEMMLLKPKIVVCQGAVAAKKILENKNFQITKQRGEWFQGPYDTEVLVTFHPSYVLRQREPYLTEIKNTVVEDFKKVKARLEELQSGKAKPQPWQKQAENSGDNGQLSMF
ncbi:MAG TPA: uracil-DNA glycosylase [Chloroflexia bacterium]|nr:uracil-DNA glycosylase [Chloroflexia bacterium]